MTLASRQALLARYLDDPTIEAEVRADPEAAARTHDVPVDFAQRLADLSPDRVRAFRGSRKHKAMRRDGKR